MKPNTVLFALLSLCSPIFSGTQRAFAVESKEIFMDSDNLFSSGPVKPLEDLSKALKNHTQSSLFRVTWNSSASLARDYSVILYNRQHHTLKYYYWIDWLVSEEPTVIREISSETVLYTGVKDSMICRLLKKYEKTATGANEIFPKLVNYGAKKHQVSQKSYKYTVK